MTDETRVIPSLHDEECSGGSDNEVSAEPMHLRVEIASGWTACGLYFYYAQEEPHLKNVGGVTSDKSKVTCENCKGTTLYKADRP